METSATNKRLRVLLTGIRDGTLIPNPHFQRRLVWSNAHKSAFVDTVLEGMPFPEIFISAGEIDANTGDGNELIVDGQQRITTLFQYFNDSPDLRLSGGTPPYSKLSPEEKMAFLEYQVVIRDLGPLDEVETRAIFQKINSTSYALNAMEVNNSRFDGELKRFSETVAEDPFFTERKVFTSLDGRRMNDVRFVLTLIITLMSGYFNRDEEHETYLEKFNDSFTEDAEIRARLEASFAFINACRFDSRSRAWQKADLFTLLVEVDRALSMHDVPLAPDQVREALEKFYSEVDDVTRIDFPRPEAAEYYRRVRSGVNDRISRFSRGEIIRDYLKPDTLF
ncbi:MAG: DUF262 domain-containing protein [Rhodoglobus sp.]